MSNNFDDQVNRNVMGKRLEKEGKFLEAISLYEANITENFEGSFPYRRLAILYRKRNLLSEEIRVLEKAITVFKSLVSTERADIRPKLNEFQVRLKKVKSKIAQ